MVAVALLIELRTESNSPIAVPCCTAAAVLLLCRAVPCCAMCVSLCDVALWWFLHSQVVVAVHLALIEVSPDRS